jgi:hypothetical protein
MNQPPRNAQSARVPQAARPRSAAAGPLAQLTESIRASVAARMEAAAPGESWDPDELINARRFRRAWDRGRTLDQVEQALARKPASAGPINSHALVLRSLEVMRELSPDYLRRFLVHVETLQWLDQAVETTPREQPKPGKPAKPASRRGKKK